LIHKNPHATELVLANWRNWSTPSLDELKDLGLGTRVGKDRDARLLSRDGKFNVRRRGLSFLESFSLYHALIEMSWVRFYALVFLAYVAVNAFFAQIYISLGEQVLTGAFDATLPWTEQWMHAFFFSVQTFTTVGYGQMAPVSIIANVIVTLEAFVGLMGFALATGLLFARFAKPTAQIGFSKYGLVAPFGEDKAFMFRIINERRNELVDVTVRVIFTYIEQTKEEVRRRFHELELERNHIPFFPLNWTIVHGITPDSPLREFDYDRLQDEDAEFLVLITGFDETFSQTVHTRSSYKGDEIIWGARFADMFREDDEGRLSVDASKLSDFYKVSFLDEAD
jgi:inward rectifier potassium channel